VRVCTGHSTINSTTMPHTWYRLEKSTAAYVANQQFQLSCSHTHN
jgi:hypothetical protein